MVALLLFLTFVFSSTASAQRGSLKGYLGGKVMITGGWPGGESYRLESPEDTGEELTIKQTNGFEFGLAYRPLEVIYFGFAVQNSRQNRFTQESGVCNAKLDETRIKLMAAVSTQWIHTSKCPKYLRFQGSMGFAYDLSGKTLSLEDCNNRSAYTEIGTAFEDAFYMAVRTGFGTEKIGIFFLELRYSRSLPRISLDGGYEWLDIENRNLNRLGLFFGINM